VVDRVLGLKLGADDYLVKPFAMQELEVRLQTLVRRASGGAGRRRWRVADLVYDPGTHTVTRAGQRIDLAPIPLRLLALLMQRSPRVVARAELEREIWGDSPPDSDALRAHLHTLRTAIDRDFDPPLLHTLRGIGYQLVDPGVD
jgi:DNA-binding response OmpR family regulator